MYKKTIIIKTSHVHVHLRRACVCADNIPRPDYCCLPVKLSQMIDENAATEGVVKESQPCDRT